MHENDGCRYIITSLFLAFCTFISGFCVATGYHYICAVKANAGKYMVNEKTGDKTFVYGCTIGPHLIEQEDCK